MDFDRIDVIEIDNTGSTLSLEDLNSTGSQNNILTDSVTNLNILQNENNQTLGFENETVVPDEGDEYQRISSPSSMVRRWSQNISKISGRKALKEKTIYRLPSRNLFALKGRFLNTSNEIEINRIANEMEQHEYLMVDSAIGKQIRIDTIRALPHSLTSKRKLKDKLSVSIIQNSTKMENNYCFERLKANLMFSMKRSWHSFKLQLNSIEIWYNSLKIIEGHFGSSVGSYFKFLRWLFLLNVILLISTFLFITLPQIIYDNSSTDKISFENLEYTFLDIFTGEGSLANSLLFYGYYTNTTISLNNSSFTYSLPHAYFMTMMCLYVCTFILISSSMARSYRKSFIETTGGVRCLYSHKIFCSWDFRIANPKAAEIKRSTTYNEIKEILNELHTEKSKFSRLWRFWLFFSQFVAHLLILGMISGLGVAMWILLQRYGQEDKSSPWKTLYLSIAVNFIMLVMQGFFSWISAMEQYESARRTLHITLMRNFMLEAVIIGVLVFFWLTKDYKGCWETSIGQEIYRLVIVDFVISVFLSPLWQIIQAFTLRKYFSSMEKPDFDISRKSLGLIFNQTLLWVGLLFSPLLAAIIAFKMILMFYVKKFTLIYVCKIPKQMWRSAQTQTLYLVFTFLSLLGVIVALGYIMTKVRVSDKCGPFRGYDFMFQIFIEGVLKLKENHWFWRIIMTLVRPAVLGGILITMAVIVYYLRSKSKARQAMVKLLKDMLYLEAKDKKFLLMNITKVTQNREWMFTEDLDDNRIKRNALIDNFTVSSSTWKFERVKKPTSRENILRSRHADHTNFKF